MPSPIHALISALLPAPERLQYARRFRVDPVATSLVLGVLQFFLGMLLMLDDAGDFIHGAGTESAQLMIENIEAEDLRDRDTAIGVMWSGAFNWLLWLFRPWTWFLASIPIVGAVRMVSYGLSHEAVGEPLVWAGLRFSQLVRRLAGRADHRLRFGSGQPDRWLREGDERVLLTSRHQEGWNEFTTIEVEGAMYRLNKVEERRDGARSVYAYHLRDEDPAEVIRSLVRYENKES